MITVDLGCGNRKLEGAISVDINPLRNPDIVHDLDVFPYPFESNSVDKVYMSHSLEHTVDVCKVVDEAWRMLKVGGILHVIVPHFSSRIAYGDPTHKHYFSTETFNYFTNHFDIVSRKLHWNFKNRNAYSIIAIVGDVIFTGLASISQKYCERIWLYYVGGFDEIEVVLKKR
jgi:predicted SAM-dependent methyltransferase